VTTIGKGQAKPAAADRGASRAEETSARQAAGRRAVLRLVRQHWLAAALLGAGLVLRVLAQFAYRPALFYIDTARYVSNNPPGMDPLGYGGVLRAISPAGGLATVAAVQHLLGLAMALVIYLLLLRRGMARWLAALAIAPVLLDGYQLQIEQTIMPDTVFEAMIVAGLAILLWRPALSWRRVVAAGLVLGASATVGQVGEALLVPAVIFVLAAGGGWRAAASRAVALCAAFVVPILAYTVGAGLITGSFFLSHTGVTSFYGRAAAAADCAAIRLPAAERGMCPTRAQQAKGPDWLEYNQGSPIRPYYTNPDRAQTDSEISDFNHAVLVQQPGRLLAAYGRDAAKLFALTRAGSRGDTPISRWQFQRVFPYYPPWSSRQVVSTEIGQLGGGGAAAAWRPAAAFLRAYQLGRGYTPGPLLALAALAGLAGSALAARRKTDQRTRQAALGCLLFFGSGVFVLGVSDLFEFSWRYQLPALVTLIPAGALGISVVIGSIRAGHRSS
jgi:hypothetical protein